MTSKFDEVTKSLAQSVTRRAALKKFGLGLAGMVLACFGLANKARATTYQGYCEVVPNNLDQTIFSGQCIGIDPSCVSFYGGGCSNGTYVRKSDLKKLKLVCGGLVTVLTKYPCS